MTISKPQTSAVPEFCHDCGRLFGLNDIRLILGDRRYHADTCGPAPDGKYRVAILCSDEQEAFCWHCPPGDEHCTCVQNGWIPPALKQAIDETRQRIRECFTRTYGEDDKR